MPDYANPQNLNRYSYTLNNPLLYTDPTGHMMSEGDGGGCGKKCKTYVEQRRKKKDDGKPQTDVTEWLANEMTLQLQNEVLTNYDKCFGGLECAAVRTGNLYGSQLNLFGNYGLYDIKRKMEGLNNGAVVLCGGEGCNWVDYSAPGNIMYGYLSAARGAEQGVSWIAAGLLEIKDSITEGTPYTGELTSFFDNPGDKVAVDFGYSLYESHPNGISFEDFQVSLTTDVMNSFQTPSSMPVEKPLPQTNQYPAGYFLNP